MGRTPAMRWRASTGEARPPTASTCGGSSARSSSRPRSTCAGFMLAVKLRPTMSAPKALLALTICCTGTRTPSDVQAQPSSVSSTCAISRPRPCDSSGKVASSTRGASAAGRAAAPGAPRTTCCTHSVYRCSSNTSISPRDQARPTFTFSGAMCSITKPASPRCRALPPAGATPRSHRARAAAASTGSSSIGDRPGTGPALASGPASAISCGAVSCTSRPGRWPCAIRSAISRSLRDLLFGIGAFAAQVAPRLREAVAALPDAQCRARDARRLLHRGDGQAFLGFDLGQTLSRYSCLLRACGWTGEVP